MANKRQSRLKRTEQARTVRSTLFYIVLTIAIIAVMFIGGIPALSKVTALVAGITGQGGVDFNTNSPPPPPPDIETPPTFTKENRIQFVGKTRPGYTAAIFFNDDKIEVLADAQGEFQSQLELSNGENKVSALVKDNNGKESVRSRDYSITLDKEAPEIKIISPENGKQFFGNRDKQQKIEGETEATSKVFINDRVVIVRSDGKFDFPITLSEGENTYKIKSVDPAGNETEIEFKLQFTP